MTRSVILTLCAVAAFAVAALAEDEPPTVGEQATEYAKEFKKVLKKSTSAEAIEGIDKLVVFYNNKEVAEDKKAKKEILDALKKSSGLRDNTVVAHLLTKCGEMDDGALMILLPTLQRELKQKTPDDVIYEAALDALGKLHSENRAATKTLTDLLKNKENSIVGRAAHAIAGYENASGDVRKDLFEEVLKSSEGVFSGSQNPSNTTMVSKWNVIEQDVMEALNKLSGVKHKDPAAARQWFNDNKKRSWDKEK